MVAEQGWLYAHGFIKNKPTRQRNQRWVVFTDSIQRARQVIHGLGYVGGVGLVGLCLIIMLDSYVVRIATVSGNSMERSLKNDQRVLIDKTGVTCAHINQSGFVPSRGQIVVAYAVSRFATKELVNDKDIIIKRTIGLPGERIVINNNSVTIYNAVQPQGFDPIKGTSWARFIVDDTRNQQLDITLGNDEIFIMGDNRPGSIDSRANGPLAVNNIIGVVHE